MNDYSEKSLPIGYKWRASKWFTLSTIAIALFAETFLYGFLVPILGYMLQERLHINQSQIQIFTSAVLALHGALAMLSSPIIGHFADKSSNRKLWLLFSLAWCIIGTGMVAITHSVPILFIGRAMQGVAGSAVWIIGFATVASIYEENERGFGLGMMSSFANTGTIGGPAVSGLLLEVAGYWVTWSVPLVILIIDLLARVIMIEAPDTTARLTPDSNSERTNLLLEREGDQIVSGAGRFWRIMLTDGRVVTCLLMTITSTTVSTSFNATLPLQVQEMYGWGPTIVGLLFVGLVVPGLLIGPIAGWVRDRFGARIPAVVCSIIQAVFLGLLGISGSQAGSGTLYIASIIIIGGLRPFVSGNAPAELVDLLAAGKALQKKTPHAFGSQGCLSRVFSMLDAGASLGMMLGPIIGGSFKELIGYRYMNWIWSFLYLMIAVLALSFLEHKEKDEKLGFEESI
ncbi:uncharacterized protein EAE98_010039 [Botrytis deweyae]|uniref:Major facilitator superfamily (MFS) profile domain-containing protein n=1 Tax=Botrytis deweyae TaxID=2478750 RepID=A0ABQ7I9I9_9HELO|nr:uncharacterized protein EAE98_010039 [Botrytis deweyae]KAF7917623.1 hypothetical protein EAE98_010039 [Botrytis deweyae]